MPKKVDTSEFIHDIEDKLNAMEHIRKEAGLTQQEIADLLGIHQSQIQRWEKGSWKKSQHVRTFIGLMRALDNLQVQNLKAREEEEK
jgi:transcriptional regulator with XRE-family HTH domain